MKFLLSYLLVLFGILPVFAQNPEVKFAGELRKIMLDADLSTKPPIRTVSLRMNFGTRLPQSCWRVFTRKIIKEFILDMIVKLTFMPSLPTQ